MSIERIRSLWWVLLPIFLGIFGGIIGYFILKNDDNKLAKFCLHLSIVLTIVQIISLIPFFFLAEEFGQDFSVNI
jgi:type II secretory pathway component PulF